MGYQKKFLKEIPPLQTPPHLNLKPLSTHRFYGCIVSRSVRCNMAAACREAWIEPRKEPKRERMFIAGHGIAVVILKKVMEINIHGYARKIDKV